ncbi:hypothetical protein AXF42_Ash002589 [Apostasia shenzhenica]|uniref:Uncharacterized protein n=1 Tax=Apostasia shenzhenica TaxID=1088818 RepID=A0A2I0AP45_9ASPA|nr:hypothetical protein AXF42_Ash002589 [Apostasia shenzhenica]
MKLQFSLSEEDRKRIREKSLTARRDTSSLKISQTMLKSYSEGMLSEISSRGNSKPLNSFFLKKQEMQNFLEATNHKTFESKIQPLDLNDEEKFHSLGANMPDNGAAKNCGSHADPSYSIPSSSSMENDNVRELMGSRKPANLSGFAGTSRERTGFASVESKEASSAMPIHWKSEAVMNKVNAEYITDKDKHGKRNTTGDERSTSLEIVTNVKTEVVEVKENRNEEQGFVEKCPSSKKTLDELGKIENLYGVSTQKWESSIVVTTSGSEENVFDGHSIEQHVAGSLFGKEGALTYAYSSVCPFGTLGIWRPRHLCITTGNKQLRYFVESFSAFRGAYCIGSSSIREANNKVSIFIFATSSLFTFFWHIFMLKLLLPAYSGCSLVIHNRYQNCFSLNDHFLMLFLCGLCNYS